MNEVNGLRLIWDKLPVDLFKRILVVDAGSTDGTLEFLSDKKCEIFQQSKPGRGNAIREAMTRVTEGIIVLMASDGNDDPKYIAPLLAKITDGCDVVSGSRFMRGGRTDDSDDSFRIRRFGNRFFTSVVNVIWNAKYTDSTYGMRAFTREAWQRLGIDASRNETEFMMSIRGAKLGLRMCQIPVVEGMRAGGDVKARSLSTGWSFLKLIVRELRLP
jgi:glycosyltransferase involved in cell wall biosynthesis